MKKNTVKAFTLVEMLIVIVIIGILIASLMPRMQSAQWRARDVARKNDLAQIQTAIITSQQDRGAFPWMKWNSWGTVNDTSGNNVGWGSGMIVDNIWMNLQRAGMSSVPTDTNGSNVNFGFWGFKKPADVSDSLWKYIYIVAKRNWVDNAWFALMAKTEVEWWSNWVVCQTGSSSVSDDLDDGYIKSGTDLAEITLCKTVTKGDECSSNTQDCTYEETSQLRYLLLY